MTDSLSPETIEAIKATITHNAERQRSDTMQIILDLLNSVKVSPIAAQVSIRVMDGGRRRFSMTVGHTRVSITALESGDHWGWIIEKVDVYSVQ